MVRIGVIGVGYWGPNLLRNFAALRDRARVTCVCDTDKSRLKRMRDEYPGIETETDLDAFLARPDVDGVVIALPAALHASVGLKAFRAGKHVFMEKPLAVSLKEADALIAAAAKARRVLMVGHTFLFNSAVRKIKEYIDSGDLGDIFYIQAERLNLGKVRSDVNVMWNLAPHDISIVLYLLGENPDWVSATGGSFIQKNIEDVSFLAMHFRSGKMAHVHSSWLNPEKVRRMTIVGSRKMVTYDDTNPDARIVIHDKGVAMMKDVRRLEEFHNFAEFQLLTRSGDIVIPKISFEEPLRAECRHFVECVETGARPLTDGKNGRDVLSVLTAASASLKKNGGTVPVDTEKKKPSATRKAK